MKEVTIKLYDLEDLTEKAQKIAYEKWMCNFEYFWHSENMDTLKEFSKIFGIEVNEFEYDQFNYWYRFNVREEFPENMRGDRLVKYIQNNFMWILSKPKVYAKNGKKRISRIFREAKDLTGFYLDSAIISPILDFIKSPKNIGFEELINECLDAFFKACRDDFAYCCSFEAFKEQCEANEYLFEESGEMYKKYRNK